MTLSTLPFHRFTGLQAIGFRRDGKPIWPVMGGDGTTPPPAPPAPPAADPPAPAPAPAGDPPAPKDEPLGDAGKKALDAERKRANDAEKELARYRKAEQDKADADKTELQKATEAQAAAEKKAAEAETRALRLEVAQAKGLTAGQAKRLVGTTREELEVDADEMLADLGTTPGAPRTPAPDPSQGTRGQPPVKRAASLKEALDRHYKPAGS